MQTKERITRLRGLYDRARTASRSFKDRAYRQREISNSPEDPEAYRLFKLSVHFDIRAYDLYRLIVKEESGEDLTSGLKRERGSMLREIMSLMKLEDGTIVQIVHSQDASSNLVSIRYKLKNGLWSRRKVCKVVDVANNIGDFASRSELVNFYDNQCED